MASDDEDTGPTRSASPPRSPKRAKTSTSTKGFKWKERRAQTNDEDRDAPSGRLERGYRDRSPRRDNHYRTRSPAVSHRERISGDDDNDDRHRRGGPDRRADTDSRHSRRADSRREGDTYRPRNQDPHGPSSYSNSNVDSTASSSNSAKPDRAPGKSSNNINKEKKAVKAPKPDLSEPMIVVYVNDRLGTKAGIPCLASDSVKAFKAMVAAHIGRQPHEIMLKRQGERPFKDVLTLADYGVSNGVQLDLELDTGD